jgi:hypothetical protein
MLKTGPRANCRNCGAALAGEYCSRCGQREGRRDRGFAALLGELLGELFDWDSRFWRTLGPLLLRPGFLTAEYIAGRRARYVPPLRLYLIISFFMFLVMSMTAGDATLVMPSAGPGSSQPGAARDISLSASQGHTAAEDAETDIGVLVSLSDKGSPQWLRDLDARLEENAARIAGEPAAFSDLLFDYLPQLMFFMLPVFALLLRCCYLFSSFDYLQHLVFTLHLYSFAYLLYMLGALLGNWFFPAGLGGWQLLILGSYLVLGLRRTYGSGLAAAAGKALVLLLVNGVLLLLGFATVVLAVLALA